MAFHYLLMKGRQLGLLGEMVPVRLHYYVLFLELYDLFPNLSVFTEAELFFTV